MHVTQEDLYPTSIVLRDQHLEEAGFFPFFTEEGLVRAYMLVWQASPLIVMLDAEAGLISSSQPLVLDAESEHLVDLEAHRFARYKNLWHYDPWWLLGEKRYNGHPAVPMLKATNVVELLNQMPDPGVFTADLAQVVGDLSPYRETRAKSPGQQPATSWVPRDTWPGLKK